MPDLQTGRADHGCGYFINEENTKVLLVTGGSSDNGYGNDIDTTEVYVHATAEWKFSARLPGPRRGLRGISLNNSIFMIGGYTSDSYGNSLAIDSVLRFEGNSTLPEVWTEVGKLSHGRGYH